MFYERYTKSEYFTDKIRKGNWHFRIVKLSHQRSRRKYSENIGFKLATLYHRAVDAEWIDSKHKAFSYWLIITSPWCQGNRKWQDYVYIQCEYKSTKQKIKHLLREENKVKENKIS